MTTEIAFKPSVKYWMLLIKLLAVLNPAELAANPKVDIGSVYA